MAGIVDLRVNNEMLSLLADATEQVKRGEMKSLALIGVRQNNYHMSCTGDIAALIVGCEKMKSDMISALFSGKAPGGPGRPVQ